MLKKTLFKRTCIVFLSALLVSGCLLEFVSADGEGWLAGWTFRKSHTIYAASGSGTNYQVLITVDYGSGSDSGDTVYLDGECESDFADIRFTDNDGETLLDAWNITQTDGDSVQCWVEVADDLSSSDVVIYIYYGNSEASAYWDGLATFIRWDDFDLGYSVDDTLNESRGWETEGLSGGSYILIKDNPSGSGQVLRIEENGDTVNTIAHLHFGDDYDSIAVGFSMRRGQDRTAYMHLREENTSALFATDVDWTLDYWRSFDGSWSALTPPLSNTYNVWYDVEFRLDYAENFVAVYESGTNHVGDIYTSNYVNGADAAWWLNLRTQVGTLYIDTVYVRKFVETEPTHGAWGTEEGSATTVTFYFNSDAWGAFFVNGTEITVNGTSTPYTEGVALVLVAVPANSSYIFDYFTWGATPYTTNPYTGEVGATNFNVWCFFDEAGGVIGYTEDDMLGFGAILTLLVVTSVGLILGIVYHARRQDDERGLSQAF